MLHLEFNNIEILTKKMFKHNGKLQGISLTGNRIMAIQAGAFDHMNELTYLYVNGNKCITKHLEESEEVGDGMAFCYDNWNSECFGF